MHIHNSSQPKRKIFVLINVLLCNCLYNAKNAKMKRKIYSLVSLIMRVVPPIFMGVRSMVVLLGQLIEY